MNVSFDFVVDPVFETVQMNNSTWAFTVAGIHQRVVLSDFIGEANFASALQPSLEMEDVLFGSVDFLKIKRVSFFGIADLEYDKFDSSQLDKVASF